MSKGGQITVFVLAHLDPDNRVQHTLDAGLSIADVVAACLPGLEPQDIEYIRVTIGDRHFLRDTWAAFRPRPGSTVIIRVLPGDSTTLRAALVFSVAIAALTLAPPLGVALAGTAGAASVGLSASLATSLISVGLSTAGGYLVNALIPARRESGRGQVEIPSFSISGMSNPLTLDGPVPCVLGRHRMAPPFAARPYTESDGINNHIRVAFVFGYGELSISAERIGDTPIDKFIGVDREAFPGTVADGRMTKYPTQVIQDDPAVELTYARQTTIQPDRRFTAARCSEFSIDIFFPVGLINYFTDGNGKTHQQVQGIAIGVRRRLETSGTWENVDTWPILHATTRPFTATRRYTNPTPGRYEIEVIRVNFDFDDLNQAESAVKINSRTNWTALRSFRARYPLSAQSPLALADMRILATGQLSGNLENYNAIVQRVCLDWDAGTSTWIKRATSNPASLWRYVRQNERNFVVVPDDKIDLEALQYWHGFCVTHGLYYNRIHDFRQSLQETLDDIAAVGRASTLDAGDKWSVVIDEIKTIVIGHISPRNSWGFGASRKFLIPPDAMRVKFRDETGQYGYSEAERVIPWPGFTGVQRNVEAIDMPGITNPDTIWREIRRRQYEIIHRPDEYTVTMDFEALNFQRGDLVKLSHDVLDRRQVSARVRAVNGAAVVLDENVTMEEGQTYAVTFRINATVEGQPDTSLTRSVVTVAGITETLFLDGPGPAPSVGDLAMFGHSSRVTYDAIIKGIEHADALTRRVTLIDHAPQIQTLTAAEVPPPWDGLAGDEVGMQTDAPPVPVLGVISSGLMVDPNPPVKVFVPVSPGVGGGATAYFEVQHRLSGAGAYTTLPLLVGSPGLTILGYANGNIVEVRARAVGVGAVLLYSAYTAISTHNVGAADPVPIHVFSFRGVELASGSWQFDWTLNEAIAGTGIRVRYREGTWYAWSDLEPLTTGVVTESPWFSGVPVITTQMSFTFGAIAININGVESGAPILTYAATHNWVPRLDSTDPLNAIEHISGWI